MAQSRDFIAVIAGTIVISKPDLIFLSVREQILPSIVKSDEPDRGEIETAVESRGGYPKLARKDLSIESTIRSMTVVKNS